MPRRPKGLLLTLVLCAAACAASTHSEEPGWVEPDDEVLCHVNNQKIGRRDVEVRIATEIMVRLEAFKRQAIAEGRWDGKAREQYQDLLMPELRNELRGLVKEKLMLQEARERKLEIDETEYQARLDRFLLQIRTSGAWIKPDVNGAGAILRQQMLLQAFRNSLVTVLDLPKKPQIERYYAEHRERYVRPATAKLRILKVRGDRKGPGGMNAFGIAQALSKDVAEFGANFEDLAREKSDDEETRPRGGLMLTPEGGPYIDPEANRILAPVVRKLGTGSVTERVSGPFALSDGWAIVFLEERRPAGPAELDSALYDKIRETLVQEVVKRNEKEWLLSALKRSLILDGRLKPIPPSFFFPDDPSIVDGPGGSEQNKATSAKASPSKER